MAQMLADPKEAAAAPVRSEMPVAARAETPAPAAARQPPARRRLRLVQGQPQTSANLMERSR
jgi:hypothetical protein